MNDPKMRYIALAGGLAGFLLILCGALYLAIIGRDVDSTLAPIVGFATPTIAVLFATAGIVKGQQETTTQIEEARTSIDEVKQNVNGRLSQLLDNHATLQQQYNSLHTQAIEAGITPNTDFSGSGGQHRLEVSE